MTCNEEFTELVEEIYFRTNRGFLRKVSIHNARLFVNEKQFTGELWDRFVELIENEKQITVSSRWILSYNFWTQIISIAPQINDEELEFVFENNKLLLDKNIIESIESLSHSAMEDFVVDILRNSKEYKRVIPSPKTRDGGVDFRCITHNNLRILGEIKKWNKPVSEATIDRLAGAMKREKVRHRTKIKGILVATKGISDIALKTARMEHIEIWDIHTLVRMIKKQSLGLNAYSFLVKDNSYWEGFHGI
ncbi:restriction endonuclease [Candidatus Poseidoniales archaeon]|nr:restriction endonuclease [Candidatus Poseidoniales archaeon]